LKKKKYEEKQLENQRKKAELEEEHRIDQEKKIQKYRAKE
jgi:hypothetical protein